MTVLAFVGAAAIGAIGRWQAVHLDREGLPFGTLLVNVVAAFVAGLLTGVSPTLGVIVVTAGLGSLSTFSTLTAEIVDLRCEHGALRAIAYAVVTCTLGIAAATLGLAIAE